MKSFRVEKSQYESVVTMTNGDKAVKTNYVAVIYQATPKGYYAKEKIVFNYRFKSEEDREKYVNEYLAKFERYEKEKQERIEKRKEAQKNLVNPYKVGDIFYDSWGYDQTNIDFYQVIGVSKKSVKLMPIGQIYVESAGDMCEYVAPNPNQFIDWTRASKDGKAITKMLKVGYDGKPYIGLMEWKNKEKIYQSHYA